MEHRIQSGNRFGFTLIEMMIVMAIISIMVSIAVPLYQKSLIRTKESLLKNQLFTLRTVIDEYTFDKQKAPQTLDDLVNEGYLRAVPIDPMTGNESNLEDHHGRRGDVDQTRPSRGFGTSAAARIRRALKARHIRIGEVARPRARAGWNGPHAAWRPLISVLNC